MFHSLLSLTSPWNQFPVPLLSLCHLLHQPHLVTIPFLCQTFLQPGGHFGAIIVNTEAVQFEQTGPAVVQEVGPLLLVRVPGDITESAEIVEFKSDSGLYQSGPVEFTTRVRNTGNVHFKPKGTIEWGSRFCAFADLVNYKKNWQRTEAVEHRGNRSRYSLFSASYYWKSN